MIEIPTAAATTITSARSHLRFLGRSGSMTGAPKIRAMQIIEDLESTKRGLYSGTIGYITPNHDFDFNVVIRTLLYNSAKQYLSLMVGSAITDACNAEDEYDETILKAQKIIEHFN